MIYSIKKLLLDCKENNIDIHFLWTPAHKGITGNEIADAQAKASLKEEINESSHFYFKNLNEQIKKDLINDSRKFI